VLWIAIMLMPIDPDPNFHVDADADPYPDWHQMMPILVRIPSQVLHMLENKNIFLL
jgi:hypothetical protein